MVSKQVPLITHVPYLISVKCTNISLYFYASPTQNLASLVKRIHPNYCHMDYSTPTLFHSKPMRHIQKKSYIIWQNIMVYLHLVWHSFSWLEKIVFFFKFCLSKMPSIEKRKISNLCKHGKRYTGENVTFKIYFLLKDLSP